MSDAQRRHKKRLYYRVNRLLEANPRLDRQQNWERLLRLAAVQEAVTDANVEPGVAVQLCLAAERLEEQLGLTRPPHSPPDAVEHWSRDELERRAVMLSHELRAQRGLPPDDEPRTRLDSPRTAPPADAATSDSEFEDAAEEALPVNQAVPPTRAQDAQEPPAPPATSEDAEEPPEAERDALTPPVDVEESEVQDIRARAVKSGAFESSAEWKRARRAAERRYGRNLAFDEEVTIRTSRGWVDDLRRPE